MSDLNITAAFAYDSIEDFVPGEIDAKVIVHFRPSPNWKGKGYGFDWMRIGDYKEVLQKGGVTDPKILGGDIPFKEIVSKHYKADKKVELEDDKNEFQYGIFKKDATSFENLGRDYQYHKISAKSYVDPDTGNKEFERYYCSWLSIYPEKSAILSLIIEVLDDTTPYEIVFNEDDFVQVGKLKPIDKLPKGRHIIPDAIEVKNLKALDENTFLKAAIKMEGKVYENREVIPVGGKLILWPNNIHKQKKPKVLNIFVKTQKDKDRSEADFEKIEEQSKNINDYLKQMLIELKDAEFIKLEMSDDDRFKPSTTENLERGWYYDEQGVVFSRTYLDPNDGGIDMKRSFREERLDYFLVKQLNKKVEATIGLKNQIGNPDDYIKIFFVDRKLVSIRGKEVTDYGHGTGKDYIVLGILKEEEKMTIPHELGHAFHLEHTFQNKEFFSDAKYTFESCRTNNIMDYSDMGYKLPRIDIYTFFKWQWDIANKAINADGSIKEKN